MDRTKLTGRAYCDAHPAHLTPLNLKRRAWVSRAAIPTLNGYILDPIKGDWPEYRQQLNDWWNNLKPEARDFLGPAWKHHCRPPTKK